MKILLNAIFFFSLIFSNLSFGQWDIIPGSGDSPRDVETISSENAKTITKPKLKTTRKGFKVTYAQMSIGFDKGCNPNKIMSDELNECATLPENVKQLAIDYCLKDDKKKAVFYGNTTNFLQMTVSRFRCK